MEAVRRAAERSSLRGRVVGSFSAGSYLRFGEAIFAVADGSVAAGPLHLIVSGCAPDLAPGSSITMSADRLRADHLEIDLTGGHRWRPGSLSRPDLLTACSHLAAIAPAFGIPTELHPVWVDVEAALVDGDLDRIRLILQGRGSGLTPVGDDVLAGLILLDALLDP
ncbi:MAG: DUF2877 domain-containing protein, partial [Acidimicrobiia bacterium]|nr:DUF2877 domain-containing protein [Acidimicrobiia bacterium]